MSAGLTMGRNRWIEPMLVAVIIAGLLNTLWFFSQNGYLPPPYFYDPYDTWMDWFNTSWWAYDPGTYDNWKSIYPPVSFVFLKIFSVGQCMADFDAPNARDCDWLGVATIYGFFLLDIFLIAKTFFKHDRNTAPWRTIALGLGLPMTLAVDRGNIIIVCFTCFLIAYGPLSKSVYAKWIAAGLAVNFKVYLIAAIFPQLLRRKWLWFEGAIFAVIAVYVLTYGILGKGTIPEIINNIRDFAEIPGSYSWLDSWNAATYKPLIAMFSGSDSPIVAVLGSAKVEYGYIFLVNAIRLVQVSIIIASIAAWFRPEVVPIYRLTNLGILFALITAESGAYTQILFIFLTFLERWRGACRIWAIVTCYVLCMPFDIRMHLVETGTRESFLSGRPIFLDYYVTYAPIVRPGLILMVPFMLSCATIYDVWADIRKDGWSQRGRYRFDMMLFGRRKPMTASDS